MNSIYCIHPYQWKGMWVFDDEVHGLQREPFVAGADTVIDQATALIPDAGAGFNLLFSSSPFPSMDGARPVLTLRLIEETKGATYMCEDFGITAWLCPALYRYYTKAPAFLFAQFLPMKKQTKRKR